MAKFKPFHVLTGSGVKEIGSSPYGTVRISGYDGTANITIGFIGAGDVFHPFQDADASQVAPFDSVVDVGKGVRLAIQHSAEVTLAVAEV